MIMSQPYSTVVARLCAKAADKDVEITLYEPKAIGVDAKKTFPFRTVHFYAEPRAAKELLGWTSKTNLPEDLKDSTRSTSR